MYISVKRGNKGRDWLAGIVAVGLGCLLGGDGHADLHRNGQPGLFLQKGQWLWVVIFGILLVLTVVCAVVMANTFLR